jgi:hypothetical protein
MAEQRITSSLQAAIALGRAMSDLNPLPNAAPYLTVTLATPDGTEAFHGSLTWAGITRLVALLEAQPQDSVDAGVSNALADARAAASHVASKARFSVITGGGQS